MSQAGCKNTEAKRLRFVKYNNRHPTNLECNFKIKKQPDLYFNSHARVHTRLHFAEVEKVSEPGNTVPKKFLGGDICRKFDKKCLKCLICFCTLHQLSVDEQAQAEIAYVYPIKNSAESFKPVT